MKKFIFGVMLLVSMLGIVGCSMDSSDSTSDPVPETPTEEEIVYTIKNESGVDVIFYYSSNTGTESVTVTNFGYEYTIEYCKSIEIAKDDSCTIKKSDCRVLSYKDDFLLGDYDVFQFAARSSNKEFLVEIPLDGLGEKQFFEIDEDMAIHAK